MGAEAVAAHAGCEHDGRGVADAARAEARQAERTSDTPHLVAARCVARIHLDRCVNQRKGRFKTQLGSVMNALAFCAQKQLRVRLFGIQSFITLWTHSHIQMVSATS